jgi:hypothetical protein
LTCAQCQRPIVARGLCTRCYQAWRGKQPLVIGQKVAAELQRALTTRGTSAYAAAKATGLGVSTVHGILRGKTPRYTTAVKLAEHLHWERLATLALTERMRTCPTCGMEFMSAYEKVATYCSRRCRMTARQRRLREHGARQAVIVNHRLAEYRAAIAAHCRGCEPFGLCRDAACEIQKAGLSPFPLVEIERRRIA